ncbi:DUF192 domain-containing protein [Pseudomonas sp.]|uniref:DUF192 domain-containing protein n=1 Tax=Pseudomonas sp. TaxID=306 RepID=UPI0028AABBED|nr:DUF192 domain-containing protein [Pseudomonas sp.]
MLRKTITLATALLCSGLAAEPLPQALLQLNGHVLGVEVAATREQRQLGLMGREQLAKDRGMLFVFDDSRQHCFWMRDTPLALSAAFLDEQGRVLNIVDMQPFDDTEHCSAQASLYGLEVPQGWFAEHGVRPGQQVEQLPQD